MKDRVITEPVRVLFHLNGYTKVVLERTKGVGLADGGVIWDLKTEKIPHHLRKIGSRFAIEWATPELEENDPDALRAAINSFRILEPDEG